MSLIDKIIGIEDGGVMSAHIVRAAANEIAVGNQTLTAVVNYYSLDATEETELNWLVGRITGAANKERVAIGIETVLNAAEANIPGYVTKTDVQNKIIAYG